LLIVPWNKLSFGAAFTSFYRLVGPYKSTSAPQVIKTEIWDTITRRGILGNLLMGVVPMAFYLAINFAAFVLELIWVCGSSLLPRAVV
jgi:dimethylaniline monooxygenase (N-oxide forming)